MTVYLVISQPKIPYLQGMYMVLANPGCLSKLVPGGQEQQCRPLTVAVVVVAAVWWMSGLGGDEWPSLLVVWSPCNQRNVVPMRK
jgi:hypothetical protein